MVMKLKPIMAVILSTGLVACTPEDGSNGIDGQNTASQIISLSELATYESGVFDQSAAEIVDYDSSTKQTFVVNSNSGTIDVLDNSNATQPELTASLSIAADMLTAGDIADVDEIGAANSVTVKNGLIAIAVQAGTKTDNGWVVFYNTDLTYNTAVQVGALPDMVTFTPDGSKVLVANEGEPSNDYSIDPEGTVSVITIEDFSEERVGFSESDVADISKMIIDGYSATNTGNKASFAQMVEPEYITVAEDGSKAYVALQENNAIAVIDLADNSVEKIFGLGFKDHSIPGNEMDASQKDGVNIKNWPVMGIYMPDSITSMTYNNKTYILTANEGDDRQDWLDNVKNQPTCEAAGYFFFGDDGDDDARCIDAFSAKDFYDADNVTLVDAEGNPFAVTEGGFGEDNELRRLKFSYHTTAKMNGGTEFTKLYSYGGRSFSIYDAQTGQQVFDSGNFFETKTAQLYGEDFNNDNAENAGDDRSDNKGPEPEAITVGKINGHTYAFIGLERMGGIMVYDVSSPNSPKFVEYFNNRNVTVDQATLEAGGAGDLGPEGFKFLDADQSPSGKPMLIVGNEVSGTTSYYNIDVTTLSP